MLGSLRQLVAKALSETREDSPDRDHALRVATAALLIEMSRADYDGGSVPEKRLIERLLREQFALSAAETAELFELGEREAADAVSLHDFTRVLHDSLRESDKHAIVEMLWRVAYADRELDRYEDHLVRKVADLLYVRHADLIAIRNRVKGGDN